MKNAFVVALIVAAGASRAEGQTSKRLSLEGGSWIGFGTNDYAVLGGEGQARLRFGQWSLGGGVMWQRTNTNASSSQQEDKRIVSQAAWLLESRWITKIAERGVAYTAGLAWYRGASSSETRPINGILLRSAVVRAWGGGRSSGRAGLDIGFPSVPSTSEGIGGVFITLTFGLAVGIL